MPYHLSEDKLCVLDENGKPVPGGKHRTRAEALAHLQALEANVNDAKSMGLPDLAEALQLQYNRERQNGAVYDALAGAFEKLNLSGFARFMAKSGDEERGHARLFFDYLADLGEQPRVDALEPVDVAVSGSLFGDALAFVQAALASEIANQAALYELDAAAEADPATEAFLIPILIEQIKSIREFEEHVTRLVLAQGDGAALVFLDHQFGEA